MLYTIYTDKGSVKTVNQDSALFKMAATEQGGIIFAAVCDGMGGLTNGEVASSEVARAFSRWFSDDLPVLATKGLTAKDLKTELNRVIIEQDDMICGYSRQFGDCGTTLSGLMLCGGRYLTVNVGDSRIYRISGDMITQLTHDQSVVQKMLDNGEIMDEEAKTHRMRNVLLQCIGVEGDVAPEYTEGICMENDVFVLCTDGFRHMLSAEEIRDYFLPERMESVDDMRHAAHLAVEENKKRGEQDNITVVVIRV